MLERLRSRLTYANVMATIAVFGVVASGGAYAASKIGSNDIQTGAVTARKLHKHAVISAKVKAGAITGAKVADDSLTTTQIDESTLAQVPSATHADEADLLNGISSDGFLQGSGSEESTITGAIAGTAADSEEVPNVGKIALTCANPAQPKSRYVNESGSNQLVFVDDGGGASASQVLAAGNATADSQAGTSLNDARHVTYFVRPGNGLILYDVWMTTAATGPSGSCNWFVFLHKSGVVF
jgi:hypothetical protein